jgi:outer membrane protein assembly factor BamA
MPHRVYNVRHFFGVIVSIFVFFCVLASGTPDQNSKKSFNVFPILMYDSDIGVGYGAKGKFVNFFGKDESFDLLLFNSTEGERTYIFVFSLPDFEIRQGTVYPLSFDLKAEYRKLLRANYYGLGPESNENDLTRYTDEKKELILTVGRGFSPHFVIEAMYALKFIRYFDIEADKSYTETLNGVGEEFSPFASFLFRYDTSDSWIHPKQGLRFLFRNDFAAGIFGNSKAKYYRYTLDLRKYFLFIGQNDVLAFRLMIQHVVGENVPLYEMSALGGGSEMKAMRGYRLNRFQDKGKFLVNAEYRFPICKKLGGNVFIDWGLVWPSWDEIRFNLAAKDIGWGLRYYLKNFVVRFDMGFSPEGTSIYFNFGHVF